MRSTDLLSSRNIGIGLIALAAVACTDSPTSVVMKPISDRPLLAVVGKPPINQSLEGEVWICKDGTGPATNFSFSVAIDGGSATTHTVALGTCLRIADYAIPAPPGRFFHTFSVTEQVPANWNLNSIVIESNALNPSVTYQPVVNAPNAQARVSHDWGLVYTFTNTFTPPPPPNVGCTRTPGYWKNHAGNGKKQDVVTSKLPIWLGTAGGAFSVQVTTAAQAIFILDKENDPASDGLNKLRTHLLAAKLNIAGGASSGAVAATIAAADAFLATHGDWNALTAAEQQQVLAWKTTLDNYNNGLTGPGHCD